MSFTRNWKCLCISSGENANCCDHFAAFMFEPLEEVEIFLLQCYTILIKFYGWQKSCSPVFTSCPFLLSLVLDILPFFLPRSLDNDTPNSEAVRNSLLESATQMVAIRNRAWDFLLLAKIQCNYVQYWPGFFLWNLLYIFCSFYHPGQKYRFLPFEFYCIEYACL